MSGQDWYVTFVDDQDEERVLYGRTGRAADTAASRITVKSSVRLVDGARVIVTGPAATPTSVMTDLPNGRGTVSIEVHGDVDAVAQMLASVVDLPADDARLDRFALSEDY